MSLNVGNCQRCNRVYVKNVHGMCPNCMKDIELQYEKCTAYLRENGACNMQDLSSEVDVSVSRIVKFIREGRISIRNNPNMFYACESCGTEIKQHKMCEACRTRFIKEAGSLSEKDVRKQGLKSNVSHSRIFYSER